VAADGALAADATVSHEAPPGIAGRAAPDVDCEQRSIAPGAEVHAG
jgi:hypothetical protein